MADARSRPAIAGDRCLRRDRPRVRCALDVRDELLDLGAAHPSRPARRRVRDPRWPSTWRALQVASSVMGAAQPGEVLVSGTVKDLVVGSGLDFADRSSRKFPGVPGSWSLFALEPSKAERVEEPVDTVAQVKLSPREREVAQLLAGGVSATKRSPPLIRLRAHHRQSRASHPRQAGFGSRVQWRLGSPEMST